MARPRTPIGTFGEIGFTALPDGRVRARTRFRDDDGRLRLVEVTSSGRKAAERELKERLAKRGSHVTGTGELTADSPFPKLVEVWLADMELEDRLSSGSRVSYQQTMRTVVTPAFEHFTLREIWQQMAVVLHNDVLPWPPTGAPVEQFCKYGHSGMWEEFGESQPDKCSKCDGLVGVDHRVLGLCTC